MTETYLINKSIEHRSARWNLSLGADHACHDKTPGGDDIVILSRAEYDRLIDGTAADAKRANFIMDRIAAGDESLISSGEMQDYLAAKTPLAFWRRKRGLTQAQLSMRIGVAQGYLSELENGAKTGDVSTLVKIAGALKLSLDDLVIEQETSKQRRKSRKKAA